MTNRAATKIARADVLVIDDFAMTPITDNERRDLFEVLDDRHGTRSTIISRYPQALPRLHQRATHADAICNRLIHAATNSC
jgi:DNA replication protein DnaC